MEVSVTMKASFDDQFIKDVLVTSFEGGSNYWLDEIQVAGKEGESKPSSMPLSEYAGNVLVEGGSIALYEVEENEDGESHLLTKEKFLKGLEILVKFFYTNPSAMMFSGGSIFEQDKDGNVTEKLDAGAFDGMLADALVQYAVFDEIVYG